MKKFLLSLLLIIPLIISLVPFSALASQTDTNLEALPYSLDYLWDQIPNRYKDINILYEEDPWFFNQKPSNVYFFFLPVYRSAGDHVECSFVYLSLCGINNNINNYIQNDVLTLSFSFVNCYFSFHKFNIPYNGNFTYSSNNGGLNNFSMNISTLEVLESSVCSPSEGWYWDFAHLYTNIESINFNPNALDVSVNFKPSLSGDVSRELRTSDGDVYLSTQMRMNVINNSRFPIQYQMTIYKTDEGSFDVGPLGTGNSVDEQQSLVFRYFSNDWVFSHDFSSSNTFWNEVVQKQFKSTSWHYVEAGSSISVMFNYSQINLIENHNYTVVVKASRCDYGFASENLVSAADEVYPDLKHIQSPQVIYFSDFHMLHYSDVKYDPSDSSNGVNPCSSYDDTQKYHFSYNASEDSSGNIDYTGKDVYNDPNSWYNHPETWGGLSGGSTPSFTPSGSNRFKSFASTFQSYFSFLLYMFNFFPSGFQTAFIIGFTSLLVLAFIKVVFKS